MKVKVTISIFYNFYTIRNLQKKEARKFANVWKLNNTLQNSQQVKRKNLKENFFGNHIEYFAMNKNEDSMYQNLWDADKSVLRGKFTAVNTYIKKEESSQINNLNFYLKFLEKIRLNPK